MSEQLLYDLKIGTVSITNKKQSGDRWLTALQIKSDLNGMGSICKVELVDPHNQLPKIDADVSVKMDAGDGMVDVFKGKIVTATATTVSQIITATDGIEKLAELDHRAVYEESGIDAIVKELVALGGLKTGTIEKGPKLTGHTLFEGPRALGHIRFLGRLSGKDYFMDNKGQFNFVSADAKGEQHEFQYGAEVFEMRLSRQTPAFDSVEITGDGAAGTQGADKYYWLPSDLSGVLGKAAMDSKGQVTKGKKGKKITRIYSGSVRSKETADTLAESFMKNVASQRLSGRIKAQGRLGINPGDRVKIVKLPKEHTFKDTLEEAGELRVRRVKLMLNSITGFVIYLDF